MKKVIVVLFMCLILCGCEKAEEQYADFEHYKLEDFNKYVSYDFISNDYNKKDTYIVADITPPENQYLELAYDKEGIFYKIAENDYILLSLFKLDIPSEYSTYNTYFYQDTKNNKNNIYLIRGLGGLAVGFTVSKEKISSQNLDFDTSRIKEIVEEESDYVSAMYYSFRSIEKVTPEFIYFDTRLEDLHRNISVKCSLNSLVCEQVE